MPAADDTEVVPPKRPQLFENALVGCPGGIFNNSAFFPVRGRLGEASLPALPRHSIYSRFLWGTLLAAGAWLLFEHGAQGFHEA